MTQNVNELPELDMLTVALVDDDPMWRFLTSTALRERGWVVEDYDSGFLLLDRLPSISADIVLIDAVMPVMDGFATCRELRKHPNGQSLPILMLTSLEDDESIRDAYDAGATDFFIKSTHWALLAERIRHLVRLNEIGRQLDRSNARLAKVHTAARAGTFDFDVASRVLRGPAGSFAVLGMENTRTQLNEEELMRLMDPDDRNQLREAVDAGVKGRRPFRVEFRLRSVAGDMRYVEAEGEPEFDAEGGLLMLHGLIRDQTDDRHRRQELERLSSHDPLTGLPNRNEFLRRLTDAIDSARATSRSVHVAVFDLDRFTQFNETLGQAAGDELICEVGRRIAAIAEQFAPGSSQDVPKNGPAADMPGMPTAWLARLPGDEFALMMHDIGDAAAAEALTQQVMRALGRVCEVAGLECFLSASAGLASFPRDADSAGILLSRADRATREVKARGRNDVGWYLHSLEQSGRGRIEMVTGLHKAIEREEFELHFQPWVDATAARVTGLEALVRWRRDGKLVPPGDFIPLAEDTGLIIPIGEWVLAKAASALAQWRHDGIALDCVAVNIPTVHFERDSLLTALQEALVRNKLGPRSLELELTETCMVRDFERTLPRLEALIEAGATLSIDDFGTGYSSLAYLTRLPISKLKVDRAFVNQLGVSRQGEAVCRAIVALGQSLGVKVLAEGVETPEQVKALLSLGCRTMQGFLFSRPVPFEQIPQAIRTAEALARRLLAPPEPEHALPEEGEGQLS
jgi:predicted signal transduction protein with EAL and GGDEF domain/DNA-binding response OmpR family regulator